MPAPPKPPRPVPGPVPGPAPGDGLNRVPAMAPPSRTRRPERSTLGATGLRRRRRAADPMREFDALPPPLRRWLSTAALPWSPASCRRIWLRAKARGEPPEAILARLERAQAKRLEAERRPTPPPHDPGHVSGHVPTRPTGPTGPTGP